MTSSRKVYLVTGANIGLGLDAVRQLALQKDTKTVYLACRTKSKALKAIDRAHVVVGMFDHQGAAFDVGVPVKVGGIGHHACEFLSDLFGGLVESGLEEESGHGGHELFHVVGSHFGHFFLQL